MSKSLNHLLNRFLWKH